MSYLRKTLLSAGCLASLLLAPSAGSAATLPNFAPVQASNTPLVEQVRFGDRIHTGRFNRGGGVGLGAAILGGAILSGVFNNGYGDYYDDYGYNNYGYYDGPSYRSSVGYCARRFRSYDPGSGTYVGYDGFRHPCP